MTGRKSPLSSWSEHRDAEYVRDQVIDPPRHGMCALSPTQKEGANDSDAVLLYKVKSRGPNHANCPARD